MKKKILASSILTVALSASLICGATYAIFTSESQADIVVSSGKVNVTAAISDVKTYSGSWDSATGLFAGYSETDTNMVFANEGTASLNGNTLVLDRITPADKVTFKITVNNLSDIAIQYRTGVKCIGGPILFDTLDISIDDGASVDTIDGLGDFSDWQRLSAPTAGAATTVDELTVSIVFPEDSDATLGGLSTSIAFVVEAVQGNAYTTNDTVDITPVVSSEITATPVADEETQLFDSTGAIKAVIPANAVGTEAVTLSAQTTAVNPNLTLTSDTSAITYDISLTNASGDVTATDDITVSIYVGKGLLNVQLYHYESPIAVDYNSATGYATFQTTEFSPFTVTYQTAYGATDEASLLALIEEGKAVNLLNDIALTEVISVTKDTAINGNGFALTAAEGMDRIFNITEVAEDVSLTLINVALAANTAERAISLYQNTGAIEVNLENVKITATHYAINVALHNADVVVNAKNMTAVTGWAAAQTWSNGTVMNFTDCTLVGNNVSAYNADGWNDFATIVTNEGVTDARITIDNCVVQANSKNGNEQAHFLIHEVGNVIVCKDTTFLKDGRSVSGNALLIDRENRYAAVITEGNVVTVSSDAYHASTEAELTQYLDAGLPVILDSDIQLTAAYEIKNDCVVYGNGNTITAAASATRAFNVQDVAEDLIVHFANVTIDAAQNERGISLYRNSGAIRVELDGMSVTARHYAINVASENTAVTVYAYNATASTGYCAVQTHSENTVMTFEDCTLVSNNGFPYHETNAFATVVINSTANGSKITLVNCTVEANQTTGNLQTHFLVDGVNTSVVATDCTFKTNGTEGEATNINSTQTQSGNKVTVTD